MKDIRRGDIYLVNLGYQNGSIQAFVRPCVVVSNPMACKYSPVIHVVPLTGNVNKKWIPTHIPVPISCGLKTESIALCEQVQLVNKNVLIEKVGTCSDYIMSKIDNGLRIHFWLDKDKNKVTC